MLRFNAWVTSQSRFTIAALATLMLLFIGLADYAASNDISLAVLYVVPVCVAAWYLGAVPAYLLSVFSVVVWLAGDYAVGTGWVAAGALVAAWNALIRLVFYHLFIFLLTKLHGLTKGLESRVAQGMTDLKAEIMERERLQKELLAVSEIERRRLGWELHDGLCQHLTGTAMAAQVLQTNLKRKKQAEAHEAANVVELIGEGIALARNFAKGLQPVEIAGGGLMQAFQDLTERTEEMYNISCKFDCESPVLLSDFTVADNLYRIGQEAMTNAVKHGRATEVVISLDLNERETLLQVRDNGVGFPGTVNVKKGMGLGIMLERAKLIGAQFDIESNAKTGTVVKCRVLQPS